MKSDDEKSAQTDATAKKKYHHPKLVYYGHIREITRNIGLAACRTSHDESHKSFVFNIDFRVPESSIVENKGLTGESPTGC